MTSRRRWSAALLSVTVPVTVAAAPSRAASAPFACETVAVSPAFARDRTAFCVYRANSVDPRLLAVTTNGGRSWRKPATTGLTRPAGVAGVGLGIQVSPTYAADSVLLATTGNGTFLSTDRGESFTLVDALISGTGPGNPLAYVAEAPPATAPVTGPGSRLYLLDAAGYRSARTDVGAKLHQPVLGVPGGATLRFALPRTSTPFAFGYESPPGGAGQVLTTYRCTTDFACPQKLFSFAPGLGFAAPGEERVQELGSTTVVVFLIDAARDARVWRSTDSGATFAPWTSVEKLLAPVNKTSDRFPYVSIGVDPARPKQLYLRVSGHPARGGVWPKGARPAEQLFRSDDAGATWRLIAWQRAVSQPGPRGTLPWNGPATGADPAGVFPAGDGVTVFAVGDYVSSGEATNNVRSVFCSRDRGLHWRTAC